MKRVYILFSILFTAGFLISSCKDSASTQPIVPKTSKAVYVCNTGASSISVIDLISGTVSNDIALVGTWPNQLVYHDNLLYCVNSGSNNISIFDTGDWRLKSSIELGSGQNPMNMVVYSDQLLYVSCLLTNKVLQVSRSSGAIIKSIPAGSGTTGISSAEGKIYATNTNAVFNGTSVAYGQGSVTVIDGGSGDSLTTIQVKINPQVIDLSPDGMLHVLCTGNYVDVFGMVMVIDPRIDQVVDSVAIGGSPGGLDASSPEGIGYISSWGFGLLAYSTENLSVINGADNYLLGKGGSGLVSDRDGNVYVSIWEENKVVKLNRNGEILASYDVGLNPQVLAFRNE